MLLLDSGKEDFESSDYFSSDSDESSDAPKWTKNKQETLQKRGNKREKVVASNVNTNMPSVSRKSRKEKWEKTVMSLEKEGRLK